jgi:hypothetical protein
VIIRLFPGGLRKIQAGLSPRTGCENQAGKAAASRTRPRSIKQRTF